MATLREYFLKDFANALTYDFGWNRKDGPEIEVSVKVGIEIYSNAKFVAYYLPAHPSYQTMCVELVNALPEAIKKSNDVVTTMGFIADRQLGLVGSLNSVVANRIYIYLENEVDDATAELLDGLCKNNGVWLTLRPPSYATKRMELEVPLAFISHDTRDKVSVAGPIAIGLQRLLCPVWYDEFSLKVGDHLRESIERGLKETKKCILVLSPNFFSNNGWTKVEFNSVFTRELIEQKSVVLPVWYKVSRQEVYDYSPSLADRVGLNWDSLGAEEVVRRLHRAIVSAS